MTEPLPPAATSYQSATNAASVLQRRDGRVKSHGGALGRTDRGNLRVLQAFRAFAAMSVVAYHVNGAVFGRPKYWLDQPFDRIFEFGHAGVQFFFVISGFIILTAHRKDIGQADRLGPYLWKRFVRIYPIYWVVLAIVIPVFFILPSAGEGIETNTWTLIVSFVLVHLSGHDGLVMAQAWTLFHEILFYALFSLAILNVRAGFVVLTIWILGSLVSLGLGDNLSELGQFYFSPLHLLFGMGMAAAWIVERGRVRAPGLQLCLGATLFAITAAADVNAAWPDGALTILYGVGSTLMVIGGIGLERTGRLRVPELLVLLGNASYSMYLVHPLPLSVIAKILVALEGRGLRLPHELIFIGLFVCGVGAGVVFYLAIEKRLLAWLRYRGSRVSLGPARS